MSFRSIIKFFLIFVFCFSCSKDNIKKSSIKETNLERQMIEAYQEGFKELERGDALFAAKKFNEAEILFPQSEIAPRAALMAAYAYYSQNYHKDAIADYIKDFDVFINSQYGPGGEQVTLLKKVYPIFKGNHIINISSTSSYWGKVADTSKPLDAPEGFPEFSQENYVKNKTALDEESKKLCKYVCWGTNKIRISNIAFGQLRSKYKIQKDNKNKISLLQAGQMVKWVVDSPTNMNLHYIAMDPIQREDVTPDSNPEY